MVLTSLYQTSAATISFAKDGARKVRPEPDLTALAEGERGEQIFFTIQLNRSKRKCSSQQELGQQRNYGQGYLRCLSSPSLTETLLDADELQTPASVNTGFPD